MDQIKSLRPAWIRDSGARARHESDCQDLVFLGNVDREWDEMFQYDLYVGGGTPAQGVQEQYMELILRHGPDGEYACFPVNIARFHGKHDPEHRWALAVKLYDLWAAATAPAPALTSLRAEDFLAGFKVACSFEEEGSPSEQEEDQNGTLISMVGVPKGAQDEDVQVYIEAEFYRTHCTHEHDCCGHRYRNSASWEWVPGTRNRMIRVSQSWYLNI